MAFLSELMFRFSGKRCDSWAPAIPLRLGRDSDARYKKLGFGPGTKAPQLLNRWEPWEIHIHRGQVTQLAADWCTVSSPPRTIRQRRNDVIKKPVAISSIENGVSLADELPGAT